MPIAMLPPSQPEWPAGLDQRAAADLAGKLCKSCGAVCAPARRGYCSDDCARQGRRDYIVRWQRTPKQQRRIKRWHREHREERAAYNQAHHLANRERYLAGMRRNHQRGMGMVPLSH